METLTFLCFTFRSYTRLSREVLRKTSSYFWWVGGGHKKPFWNVLGHSVLLNKSCFLLPRETILPEPILGFYQSPTELEEGKNPCQPYSKGRGSYWNPMKFTVQQHRLTRILQHNHRTVWTFPYLTYTTLLKANLAQFLLYSTSCLSRKNYKAYYEVNKHSWNKLSKHQNQRTSRNAGIIRPVIC